MHCATVALLGCFLCLAPAQAVELDVPAPSATVVLFPNGAPQEKGDIGPEAAQPMKPGDKTIRLGNVSSPELAIYKPAADKANGAAVVICPGGGYNILAYNLEGTEVAEWLNTIGVTGIVLKYRVPGRKERARHDAPLEDAQRAIGLVRHRASEWGLDPNRIGVLGFSAGGNLAALASTNYEKRTYAPIDDADKVSCRPDFSILIYPAYLVNKENVLQPELRITEKTPPTFIAMTEDDGVRVEGALFYYLALKQAKVQAEMHLYPTGGHGYGLRPKKEKISTWPARAGDWLESIGALQGK
ncbi:MAG: alpha/beta hydrolase [Planctomycetia bacterium]|nr:alpha/beta hydrolase [Planctomycetia bacterium]